MAEIMDTAIGSPRPSLIYRPKGIVLVIGVVIVLWSLMRGNLTALVLLAVVALFIIGLRKPLWALVALLVSQLTITSFMVPTPFVDISLRLLLFIITIFILRRGFIQREVDLGPGARRLLIPILVLISVGVVANLVNSGFDFAFKDFRIMLTGLLFVIFLPAVIENTTQLKTICGFIFIVITASAVIGIMQHYNFLGMAEATLRPDFLALAGDLRVPGMSESELELAYVLTTAILIVFGIYLTKGVSTNRRFLLMTMVLMISALYFTYTRSALLALVLGLLSIVLYTKKRIKWQLILALTFPAIFFIVQTDVLGQTHFSGRSLWSQEGSAIARPILWQAGVAIAIDNPVLGIGGNRFLRISPQYAYAVDSSLLQWEEDRYWDYKTLGTQAPHNDFLNVWVSYGTVALIAYIWIHFTILRNYFDSYRATKRRFIKGFSLGLAGALVAYVVNSFYHNLSSDLALLWIMAGFSLTTAKLAIKSKTSSQVSQVDAGNINI